MRKTIAIALTAGVAAATVGFGAAGTASAAPKGGGVCVQAGIAVLNSLEDFDIAFTDAAQKKVDYSAFANGGPIRFELPTGSFLSLGKVVSAHATSPGTFAWCDVD